MKKNNKKRITINAMLNALKTVLGIIFPLITFPYVSRVLGVETYGVYTFSSSIVSYFLLIAALGISTYGIREGTQYRDDSTKINLFVSEVFSINVISAAISFILLIVCLLVVPKLNNYSIGILILSIEIITTTIGTAWICNIYEDFLFIAIRSLAIQFISLVLTLLFVKKPEDIYIYIAIVVFANSGSNILNFFYIRKKYCKYHFTLRIDWKRHLRPILIIFSTNVAISIYVSADSTMLGFMTTDFEVGLYGTAVKIYTIIKHILSAILMVLIPQFSLMFARGEKNKSGIIFSRVFNILTTVMLPMAVGLFMLSEDIVVLIAGHDYKGASIPLRLLSIAILFSLYAYMYTQCILIPTKKESIVFRATVISALVNIGLNFFLIPRISIIAAAITTILAEAVTFVLVFIEGRKHIKLDHVIKNTITTIIGCIGVLIVCYLSKKIDRFAIRIIVSVVLSIVVYGLILYITKNDALRELIGVVKKKNAD